MIYVICEPNKLFGHPEVIDSVLNGPLYVCILFIVADDSCHIDRISAVLTAHVLRLMTFNNLPAYDRQFICKYVYTYNAKY